MNSQALALVSSSIARAIGAGMQAKQDALSYLFASGQPLETAAADLVVAVCAARANGARPASTSEYQNGQFSAVRGFMSRTVGIAATFDKRKGGQCAVTLSDNGAALCAARAMLATIGALSGHAAPVVEKTETAAAPETETAAAPAGAPVSLSDTLKALFAGFTPVAIAEALAADLPADGAALCAALVAAGMAPAGTKRANKRAA